MRVPFQPLGSFILLPAILAGFAWCLGAPTPIGVRPQTLANPLPQSLTPSPPVHPSRYADLAELRLAGELRVLGAEGPNGLLISPLERHLVELFAASQGLKTLWRGTPADNLEPGLRNGLGDLAIGAAAGPGVTHTLPWGVSREQVVGRIDTGRIRSLEDLYTRQIAVKTSSPAWGILQRAARSHAAMQIVEIPEATGVRTVLDGVASGRYDLAIGESLALNSELPRFLNLHVAFELEGAAARTWAVRGGAPDLLVSLNEFLNKSHLELGPSRNYRDDFPGLQERRMLRLITYHSPVNCYFDHGRFRGFEYELVRRFAERNQMRLEVVIADTHQDMLRLLLEGKGDLIAASLPARAYGADNRLAYTRPYNHAAPIIIGRVQDTPMIDVRDLDGRRILVPSESPYLETLRQLERRGLRVQVFEAGSGVDTETALFRVAQGFDDLTVIGSHQVRAEFSRQVNLHAQFALTEPEPLSWVVRRSGHKLLSALNDFIDAEFRKGFYNAMYARYLDRPNPIGGNPGLLAQPQPLSPYDEIVRKYADDYSFDWRLIVAQMFQESRFQPDALSEAGARGLMQVLPQTGEQVGVTDLHDPVESIAAGVRYLDYLRGQFEPDLLLEDRTWFTLAAYNGGYNRVQRARRLAEKMKLDKDRWFDNVELAMLRLARPYQKDGDLVQDCHCGQTVVYVRDIRTRYNSYVRFTRAVETAAAEPLPAIDI